VRPKPAATKRLAQLEARLGVRQIGLALAGQADAARGAVHQAHAEPRFQLRQALGGGRRGQVEGARGRGQAAVARHQYEEGHFRSRVVIHLE
jgi:hypothetical protein